MPLQCAVLQKGNSQITGVVVVSVGPIQFGTQFSIRFVVHFVLFCLQFIFVRSIVCSISRFVFVTFLSNQTRLRSSFWNNFDYCSPVVHFAWINFAPAARFCNLLHADHSASRGSNGHTHQDNTNSHNAGLSFCWNTVSCINSSSVFLYYSVLARGGGGGVILSINS